MTRKVKIYGAGSIGNHLAQACRRIGWWVTIVDPDMEALRRTREEIYPARYGKWDNSIRLSHPDDALKDCFDVIFLGTPPHIRIDLAIEALKELPKILLLEKPLCSPSMEKTNELIKKLRQYPTMTVVGYDHVLSKATKTAEKLIEEKDFGRVLSLDVEFRETWKGIFSAHPWLSGPEDTYLGFWEKGGGASGEHSHALNLWQHFTHFLGLGKVREVSAIMKMVETDKVCYDESCFLNLTTEMGFVGRVAQDVITEPVKKQVRIQFAKGFLEILINGFEKRDVVYFQDAKSSGEIRIEKKRPDDFYEEILHIEEILKHRILANESPISLRRGLNTMRVIKAAHESRQMKKTIEIDYRQ
ncbi:Gfo/Idh/MocA family oxidoreductase [Patescibacteria group bacterium]|nr:Gfo/Idh/MocA family oxidoreductase [Patescibacteria group bacterium]